MSLRLAHRVAWFLALFPAFGCGSKDLRTVITEYKPKVEPQLAKLNAIRDAARAAPPITNDAVDITGPAPRIKVTDVDEHANVAIEYLEDLDDPTSWGPIPFRILGSGSLNRCAAILATHRYPYSAITGQVPDSIPWYVAQDNFKHCEAVRYIFVIRSLEYSPPSLIHESSGACPRTSTLDGGVEDAGVPSMAKCKVFDSGHLNADVLVFDIKTGSPMGGFRFTAENSSKVDVGGASEQYTRLLDDFSAKIRSAFTEAAQKNVPAISVGY